MLCPKCGERQVFVCGACEKEYRRSQAEMEEQRVRRLRAEAARHSDDCDCLICEAVKGLTSGFDVP
jgi:hypothetical protein